MPTEIWVDASAPTGGTGTQSSPLNTLAAAKLALDATSKTDVDIYLKGTFREVGLSWTTACTRCQWLPWPGQRNAIHRGDALVTGTWTNPAGNRWTIALAFTPASVVEDWDTRIDSLSRNYGHLTAAADAASVEATAGSWFFSGGTLHIHASDSSDPNTNGKVYGACRLGNANTFSNNVDCTYEFDIYLFCDPASGSGYGIFDAGATRCHMRNVQTRDAGFHALGFVGTACVDNKMTSCESKGMKASGSNHFVYFSSAGNITGESRNCIAHMYSVLKWNGQPLTAGLNNDGYYSHGSGAGTVTRVDYRNCRAIGYAGCGGHAFSTGGPQANPTDRDDPLTFPVRCFDCRAESCCSSQGSLDTEMAFIRCYLDLTRFSLDLPSSLGAFGTFSGASAGGCGMTCESCVFVFNMDDLSGEGTTHNRRCVNWATNSDLRFFGCTFIQVGTTSLATNAQAIFYVASPTPANLYCQQCVFIHTTSHYLLFNDTQVASLSNFLNFSDCWYTGIGNSNYAQTGTLNTEAEWQAVEGTPGVYDVAVSFVNFPYDVEAPAGHALRTTKKVVEGITRRGINGQAYDGTYGAYQYGGNIHPIRDRYRD